MIKEYLSPTTNQRTMIRKRGMNPNDYVVVKNTYTSLYIKNIHTGVIKILERQSC